MSLIKCNKCGEMFSDSYKSCPFCAEDEEYYNGKVKKRGHRQVEKKKKTPSVLGPVLVLILVLLAGILVWSFAGDTVKGWFGGGKTAADDANPGTTQQEPDNQPDDNTANEPVSAELALDHMTLMLAPEETAKLTASGGSGEGYQWITSAAILKVSDDGTVTAVAEGSAVVTVTCGEESVACAVTVKANADANTGSNTTTGGNTGTTGNTGNTGNTGTTGGNTTGGTTTGGNTGTNGGTATGGTTLKDVKISTIYGTTLDKDENGRFDLTLRKGEACELTLEGVSGSATWSTQNSGIATVSNSGNVEGVSSGETIVTAKVGSGTVEIRVRVNN